MKIFKFIGKKKKKSSACCSQPGTDAKTLLMDALEKETFALNEAKKQIHTMEKEIAYWKEKALNFKRFHQ